MLKSDPQGNQPWTRYLPAFIRQRIEGRAYLQNVVNNIGWQFADNIVRMVVGLAVGIWVARYLGPEQFGLLSYALAFAAIFGVFATLGLEDILVRDLVRYPDNRNQILGSACLLRLGGGAFSFAVAVGTIALLRPDDARSQWLVAIIAAGALVQMVTVIEPWFNSQVQARYIVIAKNAAFLVCSLCKVALILLAAPLVAFAWIALAEVVLGAAGLAVVYHVAGGRMRAWQGVMRQAGDLLRDGWPMMTSVVVMMIYLRIDQIMLGELVGDEEVGIYSVAVRLAEVWCFIPTVLYWSVLPSIVEARGVSEELFYARLQKFYNLMSLSAYAVAVPVALLAQWLVPLLFGTAYARGGPMLAVLVCANLFTGLEVARSAFLTAMNWTRLYLWTVALGCLLNIALNLLLIPKYGGMGAAVASLIAYWFAAHGACFLFRPLGKTGRMLTRAIFCPKVW